jgi:LmbE family N-acetylglucosaminyl deacetylase
VSTALADPQVAFSRRLAIVSPHADDETLGCGALIARLAPTHEIHVIFATDSSRSPEHPAKAGAGGVGLSAAREAEAVSAMGVLGVARERLHFLRFPDGRLDEHIPAFRSALVEKLTSLGAADVLVPFRYDWHRDHVAVHRAAAAAMGAGEVAGRLIEYFVYTQRRLLPEGDVRAHLQPARVIRIAADGVAHLKLRALECFTSQTTLYFDWQRRPILTPELLRRMCADPESFVPYHPADRHVLRGAAWIRLASAVEPPLKRAKDGVLEWLRG